VVDHRRTRRCDRDRGAVTRRSPRELLTGSRRGRSRRRWLLLEHGRSASAISGAIDSTFSLSNASPRGDRHRVGDDDLGDRRLLEGSARPCPRAQGASPQRRSGRRPAEPGRSRPSIVLAVSIMSSTSTHADPRRRRRPPFLDLVRLRERERRLYRTARSAVRYLAQPFGGLDAAGVGRHHDAGRRRAAELVRRYPDRTGSAVR
jgi:hypothetical protein